jgi:cysteine desulfuration protein SufE
MNTIEDKQQEYIHAFNMFGDWMQKYEYIIELGKDLPVIDAQYKTDQFIVRGCQSKVWLHASLNEQGRVIFKADSDAIITKGLIALMVDILSGSKPEEIVHANLHFLKEVGMYEHLSPTRSNGLASMIEQMKMYALVFLKNTSVESLN